MLWLLLACASPPPPPADHPPAPEHPAFAPGSLGDVMVGLADDMHRLDDAQWTEDYAAIASAARRVATHPDPARSDIDALNLGARASTWEGLEQAMRTDADALAADADRRDLAAAIAAHDRVEASCVGCHTMVRVQPEL